MIKGTPHPDGTKEKDQHKKIQRSLSSSMWQRGDMSVMKNLSHSWEGRVYSSTLGARYVYHGERLRHYGGRWCSGRGVLNYVVRSSYFVAVGH